MYIRQKLLENVALTDKHTSVLTVPKHTKDVTTAKYVVNIRNVCMRVLSQQYTGFGQSGKKPFTVPLSILKGKIFLSFFLVYYLLWVPDPLQRKLFYYYQALVYFKRVCRLRGKNNNKNLHPYKQYPYVFHGCLKPWQKRLRIFSKQSSEKLLSSLRPQV